MNSFFLSGSSWLERSISLEFQIGRCRTRVEIGIFQIINFEDLIRFLARFDLCHKIRISPFNRMKVTWLKKSIGYRNRGSIGRRIRSLHQIFDPGPMSSVRRSAGIVIISTTKLYSLKIDFLMVCVKVIWNVELKEL